MLIAIMALTMSLALMASTLVILHSETLKRQDSRKPSIFGGR